MLKHQLQALHIAPDDGIRRAIERGDETIAIREGHRDYRHGPVMICCRIEPWCVMARITEVRHCGLAEATAEECRADGYASRAQMLSGPQASIRSSGWIPPSPSSAGRTCKGSVVDARRSA